MLFQCWASVEDFVPTLKHLWVDAPCLLGLDRNEARSTSDRQGCNFESRSWRIHLTIGILSQLNMYM